MSIICYLPRSGQDACRGIRNPAFAWGASPACLRCSPRNHLNLQTSRSLETLDPVQATQNQEPKHCQAGLCSDESVVTCHEDPHSPHEGVTHERAVLAKTGDDLDAALICDPDLYDPFGSKYTVFESLLAVTATP